MSRYIDADALKEHIEVITYEGMWHESEVDEFVSVENIDNAPSIYIVRCKECAKRMRESCPMCNGCKLDRVPTEDDDFCSYGERRES